MDHSLSPKSVRSFTLALLGVLPFRHAYMCEESVTSDEFLKCGCKVKELPIHNS